MRWQILEAAAQIDGLTDVSVMCMEEIDPVEMAVLVEHRVVTPELCERGRGGALILASSNELSVMVNEEDHVRIQSLSPGLDLAEAWDRVRAVERALDHRLSFAFDPELGYLTSCPSNIGTGLRASVMLHLPCLVLSGRIQGIGNSMQKLGFAIRGALGERRETFGELFQFSNQSTLGQTEAEVIHELERYIRVITTAEEDARRWMLAHAASQIADQIARAFGLLANAWKLTATEALGALSMLMLGVQTNMVKGISGTRIVQLMHTVQSGSMQLSEGTEIAPDRRDFLRARTLRKTLSQLAVVE
ncbi:MAG: ATP--guanido phosphotransferase [Lentisphaeria bacterium]|nr:ATP--guanido phosphotransferase [Lentisphaeria bacterium]